MNVSKFVIYGYQTNTGYDENLEMVDFEYEWGISAGDKERLNQLDPQILLNVELRKQDLANEVRDIEVVKLYPSEILNLVD